MKFVNIPEPAVRCRNLGGADWYDPPGASLDVTSPYTGQVIGQVPVSGKGDVDKVVKAAAAAFPAWAETPIRDRCQVLLRYRELVLAQLESMSHIAAAESGKTVAEARAGILKGLEVTEFAVSLANNDATGAMEVSRGVVCRSWQVPLGVVAGIVPFNFPAMVPMWMFPIAIAAGNCFVLKPSEKVPLTSQLMARCMLEAGLPPGVFSLVNGTRETAEHLIDHPAVKAVAFVGSTPAALAVYRRATNLGKRGLALGGAKNHLIITPDADPDITVRGVVDSFTGCAGQRCMAASLMVAVGDTDALIEKIIEAAGRIRLGADMGAIIDQAALTRITGIIGRAPEQGARLRLDGRGITPPAGYDGGYWLGPTIIDHARPGSEAATEEIFGPVLTIVRVPTLRDALRLDTDCPYGNATSVFTTSGAVAEYVQANAASGMIGINIGVPVPREPFSFGGTKASKFGACDITGRSAVEFWTQHRKVTAKWSISKDHNWMS